MAELCPAFLIEDFETAAREADAAVRRLCQLASNAASRMTAEHLIDGEPLGAWLHRQPDWQQAQHAVQRQFRARAALEQTGLPLPADALAAAERAQADFARLGISLTHHRIPDSRRQQ